MEEDELKYLDLFTTISRFRTIGINGPDPIQPGQITEWMRLNGVQLMSSEITLILDLDLVYRSTLAQEQEKNRKSAEADAEAERNVKRHA